MARVIDEPRIRWAPAATAHPAPPAVLGDDWQLLLWRLFPALAPQLRLGTRLRPCSRLELVLCEAFRCEPRLSAAALAARLARAPLGSEQAGAAPPADSAPPIGHAAAWAIVRGWLAARQVVLADD